MDSQPTQSQLPTDSHQEALEQLRAALGVKPKTLEEIMADSGDTSSGPTWVQPETIAQLTIVKTYYHQVKGAEPKGVPSRYERRLETLEDVYGPRRLIVGPEWGPLDYGWFKDGVGIGLIVIDNAEGRGLAIVPTVEERALISSRIIEVGVLVSTIENQGKRTMHSDRKAPPVVIPFTLVRPGESHDICPLDPSLLRVRCQNGSAICLTTLFPG